MMVQRIGMELKFFSYESGHSETRPPSQYKDTNVQSPASKVDNPIFFKPDRNNGSCSAIFGSNSLLYFGCFCMSEVTERIQIN